MTGPSVIAFGDLHLEAGSKIGNPDASYGNTRLRDAERALKTIATAAKAKDAYVVFGGDLARTPRPGSLSERIVIDALKGTRPLAIIGNHDYLPTREATGVHVVCRALDGICFDRPELSGDGLQIGFLPWTPVSLLYEESRGDPHTLLRLAEEKLYELITGLSEKLEPGRPSMLIGHWTVGDDVPEQIVDVVLDPVWIEAVSQFQLHVFSHYHQPGQVGERTWRIGPPLRSSFGEADIVPGYLQADWSDGVAVKWVGLPDRELVTVKLQKLEEWLMGGTAGVTDVLGIESEKTYRGQIVRLTCECTPEIQAALLQREAELHDWLVDGQAAEKVLAPIEIKVMRPERERRTALSVDVPPLKALEEYLDREGVGGELRELVLSEAVDVIG